jgi:hypothetical protein
MVTDPMVSIFDNKFDSLNTSCGKVSDEVNAANSKIVAETQEEMKAVEKYMPDIQDISHKFDFITKNGSEKQIFRLIKTLETGLFQKSEDLEKLISSLTFPQLVFKESNLLSKMETTGSVTIETRPSFSGNTSIPHGLPTKPICFSCLPPSDNTITLVLLLLHSNK